jgi:hypothetical protein
MRRKLALRSSVREARLAATASKLVTPTDRAPVASAIPRTAASPMRMPVKLPGPIVAPTMSRTAADNPDSHITASIIGSSLSVWPRSFAHHSAASTVSPAASTTEQPDPAESSASTIGSPDAAVTPWPIDIAVRSGLYTSQHPYGYANSPLLPEGRRKQPSDPQAWDANIARTPGTAAQTALTSTISGM